MYPPATLDSCDTIEFAEDGSPVSTPVILNRTALAGGQDVNYVFENDEQ
jgi:hypothetical protein